MNDVLSQIEAAGYEASDAQLSGLASIAVSGIRAGGTYLRCLVAGVQTELRPRTKGKSRRRAASTTEAAMAAFDRVNTRMYAVILAAITVDGDAAETNRRGIFARTCASALRQFIGSGGDVLKLELWSVTKRSLRPQTGERRSATDAVERATSTVQKRLEQLDESQRQEALDRLQALIDSYRPKVVATALQRTRRPARQSGIDARH
jgi:hypothetical protein